MARPRQAVAVPPSMGPGPGDHPAPGRARAASSGAAVRTMDPCRRRVFQPVAGTDSPLLEGGGEIEDGLRSEEHTSELQSRGHLVCRLLPEKKKSTTRLAPGS